MNPSHYAPFDLQGRLRAQIVTYEDVSVCNVSRHFYVLSQPPCFHALCRLRDVFMCVFAHQKDLCLHTFRIRKTCTCVTFNTWHHVFRIISHRCTWNEIQSHDFQIYQPFFACNYWHMKPCLSTLFDQYDGLWGVFTVKRHNFTQRFDLQGHAHVQIFTYKDVSVCNVSLNFHMCVDFRLSSISNSRTIVTSVYACRYMRACGIKETFVHLKCVFIFIFEFYIQCMYQYIVQSSVTSKNTPSLSHIDTTNTIQTIGNTIMSTKLTTLCNCLSLKVQYLHCRFI